MVQAIHRVRINEERLVHRMQSVEISSILQLEVPVELQITILTLSSDENNILVTGFLSLLYEIEKKEKHFINYLFLLFSLPFHL